MNYTKQIDGKKFMVSTSKKKLQLEVIHDYLSNQSYWAKGISPEKVKKAMKNSIAFGLYCENKQIGYARVITDKTSMAYIADVFVLEDFRGIGLSKFLMEKILKHPDLQNLRRWLLATKDAHGLYEQFGFAPLSNPERWMEKFINVSPVVL